MRVNNKSFTLIEVIIAAVLLTIGVAGGIAGYKIADRQIERADIKNMAMTENEKIQETIASWDIDDSNLEETVKPHSIDVSNSEFKQKYSPEAFYTVKDVTDADGNLLYKEITVAVKTESSGRNIKVQTQSVKTNFETTEFIPFVHHECVNGKCTEIAGAGNDACSTDAGCQTTGKPPYCGDGDINQDWEQCDKGDRNGVEGSGCDSECQLTGEGICGDGILDSGEECDDGDNKTDDSCPDGEQDPIYCQNAYCGDGFIWATDGGTEQCDEGDQNGVEGSGCDSKCQLTGEGICGDGILDSGEECDDGNNNGTECDPPYEGTCTYCSNSCEIVTLNGGECGDGILDSGEECDDGNNNGTECDPPYEGTCTYCSNSCEIATLNGSSCGDGTRDSGEECDDGNTDDGDGCSSSCQTEQESSCGRNFDLKYYNPDTGKEYLDKFCTEGTKHEYCSWRDADNIRHDGEGEQQCGGPGNNTITIEDNAGRHTYHFRTHWYHCDCH